jgi:hypothetical protein
VEPITRETAVMYREMGLTLREIADKTLLGYSTVEKILRDAKDDPELVKKARARMLDELAAEAMQKAKAALNNITPDSLTHDRVERRNADGELIAVQHSGPTGQQIATTFGILADQSGKIQHRADELRGTAVDTLSPDTVRQLIESIGGRIKRIKLMDIDVDTDALQARVTELGASLGYEEEEADYEVVEDPDGT